MFNHSGITVELMDTSTFKEPTNISPIMLVGTNAPMDVEIIVRHKKMTRRERRILRRTALRFKRGVKIKSVSMRKG